jgi:hypothetical protein
MRQLTTVEISRLKELTENSIELTLIEPTQTGLEKSIMDATGPVRLFLKENKVHDFQYQKQGPENKILIKSFIIKPTSLIPSMASLYRPKTKKGDPRIWFKGLPGYVNANDILGIILHKNVLYIINLTRLDIKRLLEVSKSNPLKEMVEQIRGEVNAIANELLFKLRKIAAMGPIPADLEADTSVGRTLERLLNIKTNSSKKPDYKGIELKSFRDKRGNRKNLFAQVSNWELSKFKSSAEILKNFGYQRGDNFKLYCTVSTLKRNSQGLMFNIDNNKNWLLENSDISKIGDFAVWTFEVLHYRLLEKHNETFWIAADSEKKGDREHFRYTKVEHTKKPIVSQFDILIEQGIVTMDHLIKKESTGKIVEKGPLFKIKAKGLSLLFPPSRLYNLINK